MNSNFITNVGQRKSNQDVVLIKSLGNDNEIYLLADGMGGYKNGAYAASFIVTTLFNLLKGKDNFDKVHIQSAIDEVTKELAEENHKQESRMGATLGGVIQSKEGLHCFWVGDVKIWHIKDGQVVFESIEHNLKNELIEKKIFVEAESAKKYNHIVTRAIQNDIKKSMIDYVYIENFKEGDYIMIASDGVTDVMTNNQLLETINSEMGDLAKLHDLDDRLKKSAEDNYTFILIS